MDFVSGFLNIFSYILVDGDKEIFSEWVEFIKRGLFSHDIGVKCESHVKWSVLIVVECAKFIFSIFGVWDKLKCFRIGCRGHSFLVSGSGIVMQDFFILEVVEHDFVLFLIVFLFLFSVF